jgi:periplasmic copper chaperone A
MIRKMLKRPVAGLLALAFLAGCDRAPAVTVEDAIVTLPALPGGAGGGYFHLATNAPGERLAAVSSPAAERIELHETTAQGAMTGMKPIDRPAFDEDRTLVFAPGGRHAMLFGLKPGLKPGDRIAISFTFAHAQPVTVEAEVRGPGQGHAGH